MVLSKKRRSLSVQALVLACLFLTTSIGSAEVAAADGALGDSAAAGEDLAGAYWTAPTPGLTPRTDPWPTPDSVLARLQAYGVSPILEPGYTDPVYEANAHLDGAGTPMAALMIHDTGTSVPAPLLRQAHSLPWIMSGVKNSSGQTVRACQFYIDRLGLVYIVYLGRTWHAGVGDSMFGVPADRMNAYSMGIEIESQGGGVQDLTPEQIGSASKVAAAALDAGGLGTDRAINHKDYAGRKQGKVDSAYDIEWWRTQIAAVRAGDVPPLSPGGVGTPAPVAAVAAVASVAPVAPVSANPKEVSLGALKYGVRSEYVARYQGALRRYARSIGIRASVYNPSRVTGLYGSQTRALTRVTLKRLAAKSSTWRRGWKTNPHSVPGVALLRKIGLRPIA